MTTRVPSLPEVIDAFIFSRLSDIYHILPGIVQNYYPATQEADVQIAIDDPRFDVETDERTDEAWPIYPKVRVAWPRFGGFVLIGPLSVGDKVQCFFQDLDDSAFRTTGQSGPAPRTRRFGSDAVFCLPWDITDAGAASDGATGQLVLGKDGTNLEIRISGTEINLGVGGTNHVALAEALTTALDNAASAGVSAGGPGAANFTAFKNSLDAPGVAASYTSTLVKAR